MKKFLIIIILSLLWSGNVYASCQTYLDASLKWIEILDGKKDMRVTIKNKGDLNIIITEIGLKSKDGKIMHSEKPYDKPYDKEEDPYPVGDEDFYLKPFGVTKRLMIVHRLNLDVAGDGFYTCKYGTKPVKTDQNSNSSNSSSTKSKKKSVTSGSSKSLLKKLLGKD